jgi:hypothetical protein
MRFSYFSLVQSCYRNVPGIGKKGHKKSRSTRKKNSGSGYKDDDGVKQLGLTAVSVQTDESGKG